VKSTRAFPPPNTAHSFSSVSTSEFAQENYETVKGCDVERQTCTSRVNCADASRETQGFGTVRAEANRGVTLLERRADRQDERAESSRTEVSFRECAARPGFQITLEASSTFSCWELQNHDG
jgi:hypothetical protein